MGSSPPAFVSRADRSVIIAWKFLFWGTCGVGILLRENGMHPRVLFRGVGDLGFSAIRGVRNRGFRGGVNGHLKVPFSTPQYGAALRRLAARVTSPLKPPDAFRRAGHTRKSGSLTSRSAS